MTPTNTARKTVTMDQLCIGLHVRLDTWLGHPFLFSSFKIKDQEQIDALRSMGLKEIEYLPTKSDTLPLPKAESPTSPAGASPDSAHTNLDGLMLEKKERIATLSAERARIHAAEKKYAKTANTVKNIMRVASAHPAQAAAQSSEVASELVEVFLSEPNPFIHLMGDHVADESAYFHSLNVTVLSLILARALGLEKASDIRDIAQGAILHDVGKGMISSQVLLKDTELTHAEINLIQMHPAYGIKIMHIADDLPRGVREIIMFHHELMDGSGYPKGLKAEALNPAVRVVTIANAYDNLCNQRLVTRSKTPADALSFMYKNDLAKYDKTMLSAFIKSLGIYPPGTIVVLKSGKVGIVMSVDPSDLLHPNLMIYDPAIPKESAAVLNLRRDLADDVDRTLRPSALPPAVHDYLNPRKRVCYFVDPVGAA